MSIGRYFEDFQVGEQIQGGTRTITDVEVALLPLVMGAVNPLFLDDITARASVHGGRILYGPALLGICLSLTEELLRGTLVGLLGIDKLRFSRSVLVGDSVTAYGEVVGARETSNANRGIVQLHDYALNQRGEKVLEFERTILVLRKTPVEAES